MRSRARNWVSGVMALAAVVVAPAAAEAQYVAPEPEPGFEYIFDGTATGTDASFDKWLAANGASATTFDAGEGAMDPNTSGFGMMWYPVRPLGDVVVRLDYKVEDTPTSTPNGGVMVRFPEIRYSGTTAEVLAQKPTGYNYDLCPGAAPSFCGLPAPAPSTTYQWPGADGPFAPPAEYSGAYCGRDGPHFVDGQRLKNNEGNDLTTATTANNHQHWMSVFCGHEIQINDSLQNPGTDPRKTGSAYGFQDLNAKQSRTNERQTKGVWHTMEIRMVGLQFTVFVDGNRINQFDNSIPKVASRNIDPPTMARQFRSGYFGLQTHGGTDRVWYRQVRVKDLSASQIPRNVESPEVGGSGRVGQELTCGRGEWENTPRADYQVDWYRANRLGPDHPRYRAPTQEDLGVVSKPPESDTGLQSLPYLGPQNVGSGKKYAPTAEDVGKVVYCQVSATNDGATVWKTASAPAIVG